MAEDQAHKKGPQDIDPAGEFQDFWRGYFEQTAIQSQMILETMVGGKSSAELRARWLEALGQSFDTFMRTPAFLELLRSSLQRMIELKRLQDQVKPAGGAESGPRSAGELSALMSRMQAIEETILARLGAMEERLEAMEVKLDSRLDAIPGPSRRRRAGSPRRRPEAAGGP